jgi:type II secretory pathway pseudopilin PulG
MTKTLPTRNPRPSKSEEGYVLLTVIFMLALLTIAMSVALPKISKQIQRDREVETMHRGKQYARAVRMYYKKFGAYPPNVDVLLKPVNNIRFLRKKYVDPTTGKPDWKPVHYGQNKAPTAMGFFGQPLGGVGAGCGVNPLNTSSTSSLTSTSTGGGATSSPTDSSSNCAATGLNTSSTSSSDSTSTDANAANAANTGTGAGLSGQTFGGGGIIGFSPNSPKQSILVYKTKSHYNEWEFVYDPRAEQLMNSGALGIGSGSTGLTPSTTTPTTTTTPTPTPTP